ncbi:MAG TPA: choice-of-anchor K domain-containing protein [Verrucomicrobiales bacterium]|nr:choice-of-anchor K domain-containing protein [Verrucomicrobiales bacterium]
MLGFSLLELLMVVAVISSVVAVGIFMVSGVTQSIKASKLQSDVATLNSAVRTYLTHGGVFAASADGQKVLDQMKTVADSTSKLRLAGVRSSMIDARLRGILATGNGTERAVWNPAKLRFEVKTAGTGFSDFDLAGTAPAVDAEEKRQGSMSLAAKDKWVWDSGTATTGRVTPTAVLTTSVASVEAPPPSGPVQLATPAFSLPGAIYSMSDYTPNLSVSLLDRNVPGVAKILYSINDGPGLEYKGVPLSIPPAFLATVRTYAAAINSDSYEDSDLRTANYETIYFTGTSAGNFYSPAGDKKLVTNLTGGLRSPVFKWGTPADLTDKQNQLTFTGSSFSKIAPDKEFVLGTLSYYNGTTNSGTNATSVKIAIDLNLSEPAVKETLTFTFNLLSTPNNGKTEDADADYVYIPDVSTNFNTTIKGKKFALVLRFGEHTADGFTTIDTFHAHEGKTLTGSIYGRLTEVK